MSEASDVILEARGISKSFPGVRALHNVDLVLRRRRLTALLGENGAGKSTLMSIIAGVLPPTRARASSTVVRCASRTRARLRHTASR